jgi:Flp pilus assembly protein TadD
LRNSGLLFLCLLWLDTTSGFGLQAAKKSAVSGKNTSQASSPQDLARIFQRGQTALQNGNLKEAEEDFRTVIAADPRAASAYANLGVIHMRRKEWRAALSALEHAQELSPHAPGISLDIGLVYYKQSRFS